MSASSTAEGQGLLEAELQARRDHAESPFERAIWQLVLGDAESGMRVLDALYAELKVRGEGPATGARPSLS